jgi:hypothetical protein
MAGQWKTQGLKMDDFPSGIGIAVQGNDSRTLTVWR